MSEWIPLSSSNVDDMRYNAETQTLSVRFKTGTVYDYAGVPPSEADGLASASSPGEYMHSNIIGNYQHRRAG